MSTNITLSKESSESEIKAYFNEILKLSQSDNESGKFWWCMDACLSIQT